MGSIQEYIFNDLKDLFIGKLNNSKMNSNYFDIIDSPSTKEKDCNLIMIPKLIINKNNIKNNFNELFEVAYNKLKKISENKNNEFYHQIFYFYRKNKNKSNNLATKIYTIFPNVNFEFKQIKNLSFSNTNLNKYLISSNSDTDESEYQSGFFTMSQNHRLIALKDDIKDFNGDINKSQSLKEIIFGIWINLKEEKPSTSSNYKSELDVLFNKYKLLIYKQCFRFLQLSTNIETIYTPSPEENIFILVIFYKGIQCHYEVKPNFDFNTNLDIKNDANNKNQVLNNNTWFINKCKYELDEQSMKVPFDYDIKIEFNNGKICTMNAFINTKIGNNKTQEKNSININKNKENLEKEIINDDIINLSDFNGDSINDQYNNNKNKFNIIINNNVNNNITHKKLEHEQISHASTNAHSKKPSLSLSKNSKNNNKDNTIMEQIYYSFNKEDKEEKYEKEDINSNNIHNVNINKINCSSNNLNESLCQYSNIIKQNSENIKRLENQVNKMELEIKEIIKKLENENNNNKKKKKKEIINNNNNDNNITGINDISISVPKIICKDISMTRDDI